MSTTAIENNIAQLKQAGLLERVGSAKGGYWVVKISEDLRLEVQKERERLEAAMMQKGGGV